MPKQTRMSRMRPAFTSPAEKGFESIQLQCTYLLRTKCKARCSQVTACKLTLQTSYDASEDASFPADAKKPSRKDEEGDLQFPDEVGHLRYTVLSAVPSALERCRHYSTSAGCQRKAATRPLVVAFPDI